ncbi:MAG: cupin domain-containing protein [Acidobacteria bacterium]|nr:cupin domain-containing protein [Acidobacteriota bacterium]
MTTSQADGNMIDTFASFDLPGEISASERKKPWPTGHYAKTLFKKEDFRAVLITMEPGSKMKEHHADGTISVQVLKGRIHFIAQGNTHDLRAGTLITLGASIKHEVEAVEDSAFLLTISWPDEEKLKAMKHRGYGS